MRLTIRRGLLIVAVFTGSVVFSAWWNWDHRGSLPAAQPQPILRVPPSTAAARAPSAEFDYVGVSRCASTNCHGGPGPAVSRSEYSIWFESDPHAQAGAVLFNEKSIQIARNLKLPAAHQAKECLACHAPAAQHATGAAATLLVNDGVSCETCHGPASKWLAAHVRFDWETRPKAEQTDLYGFTQTDDVLARARMCADCHVGGPGRDVNHDLLAAGHPPLRFEFAAYHANMPTHWERRARTTENEARLWLVGQFASAEAATGLLAARAREQDVKPWPEFSEYQCFACHHELQAPSWRQKQGFASRRAGSYPWGTWNFTLLPELSTALNPERGAGLAEMLQAMNTTMSRPSPDPNAAEQQALLLQREFSRWGVDLQAMPLGSEQVDRLRGRFAQSPAGGPAVSDWDAAVQRYLALVALDVGYRESSGGDTPLDPKVRAAFESIRESLEFPPGFSSPRTFDPHVNETIERQLNAIRQQYTEK